MTLRILIIAALLVFSSKALTQESVHFEQLHVGFNGPTTLERSVIQSREEFESSWIMSALADEAPALLLKVDFSRVVLIAAAVGSRESNTGNIEVPEVTKHGEGLIVNVRVGVNDQTCNQPDQPSAPFVLIAVEKSAQLDHYTGGISVQNFADGCKPVPKSTKKSSSVSK